jgi:hypothetical protein
MRRRTRSGAPFRVPVDLAVVTLAILTATPSPAGTTGEAAFHRSASPELGDAPKQCAPDNGRHDRQTDPAQQLIEAITHLDFYAGWPTAMSAIVIAKKLFETE